MPGYLQSSQSSDGLGTKLSQEHWTSRLAIPKRARGRKAFDGLVCVCLVYTGTIFLFRLCFLEFRVPEPAAEDVTWTTIEYTIDGIFWIDFFAHFLYTYRDAAGVEIFALRLIAIKYLRGYFTLNLVACFPPQVLGAVVESIADTDGGSVTLNRGLRIGRIQRISRIARLSRLARLIKIFSFIAKSEMYRWMQSVRGMGLVNFGIGLLWIVHLLACGWYLCAALHHNYEDSYLGRRCIDPRCDEVLLDASPELNWLHAMYFILTLMTTVGFGDIKAMLPGELIFICCALIVGTVCHGIIVSKMINLVTRADRVAEEQQKRRELVTSFSEHVELPKDVYERVARWVDATVTFARGYDKDEMRALLMSGPMPAEVMQQLPGALFGGELHRNKFVTYCADISGRVPPRLPVMVALLMERRRYSAGELVYQVHDHPWSVYFVMEGVFANVGCPGPEGGTSDQVTEAKRRPSMGTPLLGGTGEMYMDSRPANVFLRRAFVKPKTSTSLRSLVTTDHLPSVPLYPYQVFCWGSYFGDTEVLERVPRRTSTRCESKTASALALHYKDFNSLLLDFPACKEVWFHAARQKEYRRKALLQRLRVPRHYKHWAAAFIQDFHRMKPQAQGSRLSLMQSEREPTDKPARRKSTVAIVTEDSSVSAMPGQAMPSIPRVSHATSKSEFATMADVHMLRADVQEMRSEMHEGMQKMRRLLVPLLKTETQI